MQKKVRSNSKEKKPTTQAQNNMHNNIEKTH